jgi:hypothetical protein
MKKEISINVRLSQMQAITLNQLLLYYQVQSGNVDLNQSDIIRMALSQMAERDIPWFTKNETSDKPITAPMS